MIISVNWIKEYTKINLPIDELAKIIGSRLVEIEEVIDLGAKYKDALIVKAIEVVALKGSDHLSVAKIDDGGAIKQIERDENGLIQVVCGASNLSAGQTVVWLPPNSIVPKTYKDKEPFKLSSRKIMGVVSNGMIASGNELDISDDHDGILVLDQSSNPGTLFADVYKLNDYLLDIANKSLTHRPDCFGVVGFAREVAAIQDIQFETPDWLQINAKPAVERKSSDDSLSVQIESSDLSSRYQAVVMSNIDSTKTSPLTVQTYLSRVGLRPINAVVDATNYLMMLTGQPLHAFDYDKFVNLNSGIADIRVRAGRKNEKLTLLDGKTIELTGDDIVIASGDIPVALAGAMGGASTAIDSSTKRIIIESATFNLYKLRGTQMRHGIFSESITRFTKGQPAELSGLVLSKAIDMMTDWVGASIEGGIVESYLDKTANDVICIDINKTNDLLGSNISAENISRILNNTGFKIEEQSDGSLNVTAPYWRADIHILEDVVEEIGRIYGFDNINATLPSRYFKAILPSTYDVFKTRIRKILTRAGASEVLTYSFVHGEVLVKAGLRTDSSYQIANSISPDLQYYRQTLSPSLIDLLHPNIKQGHDFFAIYELNKVHSKNYGLIDEGVPVELDSLALSLASKIIRQGSAYYQAKKIVEFLVGALNIEVDFLPMSEIDDDTIYLPFEPKRSAKIVNKDNNCTIGVVGEYNKKNIKNFKLPDYAAGFEIITERLFESSKKSGYTPISRYPASERDICFRVKNDITYGQILASTKKSLAGIDAVSTVKPVDIYQANGADTKNITIRIQLNAKDRTLTSEDVNKIMKKVAESVINDTNSTVI